MNPIDELKSIIREQKSISTKRLDVIVLKFEKMYIAQGKKINSQKNSLSVINTKYQREKQKAERRKVMVEQFEDLKLNHKNLRREYNVLLEKLKEKQEVRKWI
ncbi:hypothetical protein LIS82_08760 [Cytobacillus solani]|uniref:hypothetical protein n=1 Tax=Cytobacillus solani TaxID=1637975 RepID=UPI00207A5FCF|nr:hypothetical protein [Cytobacillus solani]USK56542.1 hypothetical protein LIS82_08760 [Cytobacillus solani]